MPQGKEHESLLFCSPKPRQIQFCTCQSYLNKAGGKKESGLSENPIAHLPLFLSKAYFHKHSHTLNLGGGEY